MKQIISIILVALLSAQPLSAAEYFVDYVGGNDSNNGTSTATPFKHCPGDPADTGTAAATTPAAGDTIWFKRGVIYESGNGIALKSSGATNNHVLYSGLHPSWGSGWAVISNDTYWVFTDRSYNTVRGFEITDRSGSFVDMLYPSMHTNNIFELNYVHDIPKVGGTGGFEAWNFKSLIVRSNIFDTVNCYDDGFGVNSGTSSLVMTDNTKSWTVNAFVGGIIHNITDGTDVYGTITANTATTVTIASWTGGGSWNPGDKYAIQGSTGRGPTYFQGVFNGSVITDNSEGLEFIGNQILGCYGDSPIFLFHQNNMRIESNIGTGQPASAHSQFITHYQAFDEGTPNQGSGYILGNIYLPPDADTARAFLAMESIEGGTVIVANNIANCLDNVSQPLTIWGGTSGSLLIAHNTWLKGSSSSFATIELSPGFDPRQAIGNIFDGGNNDFQEAKNSWTEDAASGSNIHSIIADTFVNTSLSVSNDFRILATFAGRGQGTNLTSLGITTDALGYPRPSVGDWDMGAVQYRVQGGINAYGYTARVGSVRSP